LQSSIAIVFATTVSFTAGCDGCSKQPVSSAPTTESAVPDGSIVNVTPVPTSEVLDLVNPQHLPPYTGATGSVEGIVRVVGAPAPMREGDFHRCPDAEKTWGHLFREGPDDGKGRPLADAIVVATGYHGFFLPEKREARSITIDGCGYVARTVTMTFGQRLEVQNDSKEFWSPFLQPDPSVVLMMASPHGDPPKLYPKRPGRHLLLDRDRKYALVDVYAFLHPLHAGTNLQGHYRIDGIPVGSLKISTTHAQFNATDEKEINVEANVVKALDLVLKYEPPADAGAAKPENTGRPIVR
jgi:hypothetical protein